MKRYITIALCALTVFGLGSCNKIHEEDFDNAGHSVTFQAQLGNDTRTGLALKFVPDWRETDETKDVHIWEVTGSERLEGEDIEKTIPGAAEGNYEIALFKADFSNMTIIVNPPSTPSSAPATRAGETYVYTSIVASTDANGKYTVPSTQKPDTETLIDPHADFLVGISTQDYSQSQAGKQLDLRFTRPVAISRLSIMNVQDPTIKQVKIYSSDKLTGSASYENVNFENATVSFDNSGSNVITLDYGSGVAMPAEGIFNAYFISLVGTKRITKIEVVTNTQTLSKEFEGGKALTFKVPDFKSIAVNMGASGSVTPGDDEDPLPVMKFVRGTTVVTSDSYDLYSGGTYVSPTLDGAAPGATLTYSSSDEAVATVSSDGVVTPVGVGKTTITVLASAAPGYYQASSAEFTLTVTDGTPEPVDQPLKFMRGGEEITDDTYDLNGGVPYETPELTGVVDEATVEWDILCIPEGCATIDADGKVTPVAVGAVVVTATASAVAPLYKQTSKSYDLQIKDTTPVVGPTVTINLEAATELVAGEKYVLVSNGFALVRDGENAAAAAFDATAMTVAVPEDLQGNVEWTLEKKSGTITRGNEYAFTQGEYFFGIAMDENPTTYTYTVEVNNGREVASKITIQDHNISLADGLIYYAGNSSKYYVFYNTEGEIWDNEKVANANSPAAASKTFLYKLKDMRAEQNPTFTAATAEYDLYGPKWNVAVPELQNAQGTVTYESGNTAVATVNASSGEVTIMTTARKGDSAVITAHAAGNDEFKPGDASYTINIVNTNPNVTKYVKVTSTADLEPGAKYLLVFEGLAGDTDGDGNPKVFDPVLNSDGTQFAKATSSALDVTIASGVIESTDFDDCQFTLEAGYYLKGDKANKYIYPGTSGSSSVMLAENSASHALTIAINDGIAEMANGGRYLIWSTYSHYFSSNSSVFNEGYCTGICLYKLDDGRQAQALTFNAAEFEYDLATSTWTPAEPDLSGAQTSPLTWNSSNETVATVNASGKVTPKAKGLATISVSAPASTTHKAATASFELTVVDSTPGATTTYTKVSSNTGIVDGKQYLVVYENGSSSKVFKPILSGNTYTASADNAIDAVVSNGTIESDALADCLVTLEATGENFFMKAAGSYLYPSQSNLGAETTPTSSRSLSITITDGKVTIKRSQYTHYLGFETYFLRTGSDTGNLALYTVSDGTTPEPPVVVEQELNFSPESVSGKVGETVTKPTLTGAMTTVTYSSSDPTVAAVDENNGDLTLNSQGTATITATAAAETVGGVSYAKGTATYTVNVSPADTPPTGGKTYTRISGGAELVTGTYIIVEKTDTYLYNATNVTNADNGGYSTIGSTSGITKNGTTITLSEEIASNYEFVFTRTGDNLTIKQVGGTHAGQYMYATNSVTNTYIGFKNDATNFVVNVQANTDYVYFATPKNSSSNTEYLYKKSSDSFFKLGGSGSPTAQDPKDAGIYLYKLNDGGTTPVTPDPPTPSTQYYTKVSNTSALPTTTDTASGNYLIVYEDGEKAYVFKPICSTNPTGSGTSSSGHTELTKNGSAVEVALTTDGIAATSAIEGCKIQMKQKSGSSSWYLYSPGIGWWLRINSSAGTLVAMTSSGYGCSFSFSGTGNNMTLSRSDGSSTGYMRYSASNTYFEATTNSSTSHALSLYKLSE